MAQSKWGFKACEVLSQLEADGLNEKDVVELCKDLIAIVEDVGTQND